MRVALGSQLAQTACGAIEYSSFGRGPAVLLVHGGGGGIDQTREYALQLAAAGLRAVTLSRFGYLRTPLPQDGSAEAQADAHACLLDALKIGRAAIIGVSAGAPSSLQFALRQPLRCTAMVLMVPAAYVPRSDGNPVAKLPTAARLAFQAAFISDFLLWATLSVAPSFLARHVLAATPEVVAAASEKERERLSRMVAQPFPLSLREAGMRNDFAVISTLRRYELERIAVPTLVVSVADDYALLGEVARYTASQIPGARHVEYPGGGHLWIGRNDDVVAEVAAFIRSSRSAAASDSPAAARN